MIKTMSILPILTAAVIATLTSSCEGAPTGAIPSVVVLPPHARAVTFTKLQNTVSLNRVNITEFYVKVVESEQAVSWLLIEMVRHKN